MRRWLLSLVCLCVSAVCAGATTSNVVDGVIWYYTESGGKATIIGGDVKYSGVLTVPQMLNDYPVTAIGGSAFKGCPNLISATLPVGVTTIAGSAFSDSDSLVSVTMPYGLDQVGSGVFSGSDALKVLTFQGLPPGGLAGMGGLYQKTLIRYSITFEEDWHTAITNGNCKFKWTEAYNPAAVATFVEAATLTNIVYVTCTNVNVHVVQQAEVPDPVIPPVIEGTDGFGVVITEVKGGYVPIPSEWAKAYEPTFSEKFGDDFPKALLKESGKRDSSGKALYVWQDFVAGTSPIDEKSYFYATITMDKDNKPIIGWSPRFTDDERAACRKYTIYGKCRLKDDWTEIDGTTHKPEDFNFFKVTVELIAPPEESQAE